MNQQLFYREKETQLTEENYPKSILLIAKISSVIFHPLLLLVYSFVILAWCNPYLFGRSVFREVFTDKVNIILIIWLLIFSFLVPLLAVLMMKGLGLIKDLAMSEKTDRIGPYIIVGLLYIVIFMNLKSNNSIPFEMAIFTLGATIGIFAAFLINLFSKISMHTVGMGGFLAMMMICSGRSIGGSDYIIILAVIFSGLVGSSRLILGAHEPNEIYGGYAIGFLAQFVALSYMA